MIKNTHNLLVYLNIKKSKTLVSIISMYFIKLKLCVHRC